MPPQLVLAHTDSQRQIMRVITGLPGLLFPILNPIQSTAHSLESPVIPPSLDDLATSPRRISKFGWDISSSTSHRRSSTRETTNPYSRTMRYVKDRGFNSHHARLFGSSAKRRIFHRVGCPLGVQWLEEVFYFPPLVNPITSDASWSGGLWLNSSKA